MEFPRNPRQSGRRPSRRPRSSIYRKKNIVKRVKSTLRRQRSQLAWMYQNALIEMVENRLDLPHEGQSGLVYAVPELPAGHSRQSLIDVFDDVVANMSATTTKSSSQRSWQTVASSDSPNDLLTGDYYGPEDFDRYLVWQPLKPLPAQPSPPTNATPQELSELTWSSPRTPSKHSNNLLIDLDSPLTTGPPTPPDVQYSTIDELFFGGLSATLKSPPLIPSPSLDPTLWPQPLKFSDSPFPVLGSSILAPTTSQISIRKRAPHGNLRLDTQHPALRVSPPTPRASLIATPTQQGYLVPRKPVPETPTHHLQRPSLWSAPLNATSPYRPYHTSSPSPNPRLLPVLTRATNSLLDEMNDEIDRAMASFFAPAPTPPQIPPRITSRAAPTSSSSPASQTPTPIPHVSTSFRSRLGANTLAALLAASEEAQPSPTLGDAYRWHRWVDRARDEDSETEEQVHQRPWRERRREARREQKTEKRGKKGGEGVDE